MMNIISKTPTTNMPTMPKMFKMRELPGEIRFAILLVFTMSIMLSLAGCFDEAEKIPCCKYSVVQSDDKCELKDTFTDTTGAVIPYTSKSCDLTKNSCIIEITDPNGDKEIEVPICTGEVDKNCLNADCQAMVCGDFLYTPKLPPPTPTEAEQEEGVIPINIEEESVIGLYHAECKFLPMDEDLNKIIKNTGAQINVMRFGFGSSFEEYEKYKYVFPVSDKFCGLNPTGRIDRFTNYLDFFGLPSYDPSKIDKYECAPASQNYFFGIDPVNYKETYPFIFSYPSDQSKIGYRESAPFYARALTKQYQTEMFDQNMVAPFECKNSMECLSGNCNYENYHRSFIYKKDGSKEAIDCYTGTIGGKKTVACTTPAKREFTIKGDDVQADIEYNSVETYIYRYLLKDSGYSLKDLGEEKCEDGGSDNMANLARAARAFAGGHCDNADYCGSTLNANMHRFCVASTSFIAGETPNPMASVFPGGGSMKEYLFCSGVPILSAHWGTNQIIATMSGVKGNLDYSKVSANYIRSPNAEFSATITAIDADGTCAAGTSKAGGGTFTLPSCGAGSGTFGYCYADSQGAVGNYFPPAETVYFFNSETYKGYSTGDDPPIENVMTAYSGTKKIIGYATGKPTEGEQANSIFKICNMKEGDDYTVLDITHLKDGATSNEFFWQFYGVSNALLDANRKDYLTYMTEEDDMASSIDMVMASTPWVIAYRKCKDSAGNDCKTFISKPEYQVLADNNVFDLETMDGVDLFGPSWFHYMKSQYEDYFPGDKSNQATDVRVVQVLASRYMTVIHSLGDCEAESGNPGLPKLEEMGWCESCTYATMPYETLPVFKEGDEYWEYQAEISQKVSNYLKNNVLPVLDLRDKYKAETLPDHDYIYETVKYFMVEGYEKDEGIGPVITIVDDEERAIQLKEWCPRCLIAQSIIPNQHVTAGTWFVNDVTTMFKKDDQGLIDVLIMNFSVPLELHYYAMNAPVTKWDVLSATEKADAVVEHMYKKAWKINDIAKKTGHKPVSIVMLFYVDRYVEFGSKTVYSYNGAVIYPHFMGLGDDRRRYYSDFYSEIFMQRDKLRKAGVIGLIYMPFEGPAAYSNGDGKLDITEKGMFSDIFCAFQEGTLRMTASDALTKTLSVHEPTEPSMLDADGWLQCEPCGPNEYCTLVDRMCDDGTFCNGGPGIDSYRCPPGFASKKCKLCNAKSGEITCLMRKTSTPTDQDKMFIISSGYSYNSYFKDFAYSALTVIDADIIATLPSMDRCCLEDEEGKKYTFKKSETNLINNLPIMFSPTQTTAADAQLQDCGFADMNVMTKNGQLQVCGTSVAPDEALECKQKGSWLTYDR